MVRMFRSSDWSSTSSFRELTWWKPSSATRGVFFLITDYRLRITDYGLRITVWPMDRIQTNRHLNTTNRPSSSTSWQRPDNNTSSQNPKNNPPFSDFIYFFFSFIVLKIKFLRIMFSTKSVHNSRLLVFAICLIIFVATFTYFVYHQDGDLVKD